MPRQPQRHSHARVFRVVALCTILTGCGKGAAPVNPPQPNTPEAKQPARELQPRTGQCTLVGNFREANDDAVAIHELPGATLCLVADGMGGNANGRDLGQLACERAIAALVRELKSKLPQTVTSEEIRQLIRRSIVTANEEIMGLGAGDPALRNMGATLVLALWHNREGLFVAGVGDSRVYLLRGNSVERLTVDHTLAQALVEAGTITPAEAKDHRFKSVLWKYLGSKEVGEGPEVKSVSVRAGDRILLSSDGLHGVAADNLIAATASANTDPQKAADALCRLALDAGSRDNVSCVLLELGQKP